MTGKFVIENVPMPDGAKPSAAPSPSWSSERTESAAGARLDQGQRASSHDAFARAIGPEKLIAEPVTLPKKYARAKLETATDIGNELARIYRLMKSGELDPNLGTKLTYVLSTLAKVRGDGDIERRIEALEMRRIN